MDEQEPEVFLSMPGDIRQFVRIMGMETCEGASPRASQRVWFQRTAHNDGSTIYLFKRRPLNRVTSWYAKQAFGWIPEWPAEQIWLSATEGWCNFWSKQSEEAKRLEIMNPHQTLVGAEFDYIEFTDHLSTYTDTPEEMRQLGLRTVHVRHPQHWRTPASVASAVLAATPLLSNERLQLTEKGISMAGSFDPYQAAAEQQTRLASSSKQGKSVNNIKQACGTALSNVATNNKAAAIDAGYLTAGTIANNQFSKLAGKHLPMIMRGYADTPFGKLVLANAAQMLVQHFKADNKAANRLTEAMMTSAMAEVIGSTGIEELIDSFLSDPKIAKALKVAEGE